MQLRGRYITLEDEGCNGEKMLLVRSTPALDISFAQVYKPL